MTWITDSFTSTLDQVGAGIPNILYGEWTKNQARDAVDPYSQRALSTTTPGQRVAHGRGDGNLGVRANDAGTFDYFSDTGIGSRDSQGLNLPGVPGREDYASARWQGAINQYETERQMERELRDQVGRYGYAVDQSNAQLGQSVSDTQTQRQEGLQSLTAQYAAEQAKLADASLSSRINLRETLSAIGAQLAGFADVARNLMGEVVSSNAAAIESHGDRTAQIMDSMSQGYHARARMEESEILGRKDIPPAVRDSIARQSAFVNMGQLRTQLSEVQSSEAARHTAILTQNSTNISAISSAIASATGSIGGMGLTATQQAYAKDTDAQTRIAEAGADFGKASMTAAANYHQNMTSQLSFVRHQAAAFRTAGQMDIYNMLSTMPRAYADFSGTIADIQNYALTMDRLEYDDAVNRRNLVAADWSLQTAQSHDAYMQGLDNYSPLGLQQFTEEDTSGEALEWGAAGGRVVAAAYTGGASETVPGGLGRPH